MSLSKSTQDGNTRTYATGTEALKLLHPETAKITREHKEPRAVAQALRCKANELLGQVEDGQALADAAPTSPFNMIADHVAALRSRVDYLLTVIFPYDTDEQTGQPLPCAFPPTMEDNRVRLMENAFDDIESSLSELVNDYRQVWLAGLLDHVKHAQRETNAKRPHRYTPEYKRYMKARQEEFLSNLPEAPDTFDTSGDEAEEAPYQPREEAIQLAIPGVGQLLPAMMMDWASADYKGGRELLQIILTPEQFAQLNVRIVRITDQERETMAKAGYPVETPDAPPSASK